MTGFIMLIMGFIFILDFLFFNPWGGIVRNYTHDSHNGIAIWN